VVLEIAAVRLEVLRSRQDVMLSGSRIQDICVVSGSEDYPDRTGSVTHSHAAQSELPKPAAKAVWWWRAARSIETTHVWLIRGPRE